MRKLMIAAAMMASAAPAFAQVGNSQGLVNVTVSDVSILNDFLNDTQIAALNNLNVPITAQVPISVAANVCGTTVALLSAQRIFDAQGARPERSGRAFACRRPRAEVYLERNRRV